MGLAFLFPGQGSQSAGMGADLFEEFADLTATAEAVLGYSVRDLCLDGDARLHQTEYSQPALFTVNALSYLHRRRLGGPTPDYLAGHSLGELSALFAAGSFDFETGLRIVRRRGELMAAAPDGGMMAVLGLPLDRLTEVLRRGGLHTVDVANDNVPGQVVLSGPRGSAHTVAALLANEGAGRCVPLNVSIAAHSRYMADAARQFGEFLADVRFAEPEIPVIANVTARPHQASEIAGLLVRHLCEPVRWWDTLRLLAASGVTEIEEIGPGDVLQKMWQRGLPDLPQADSAVPAVLAAPSGAPVHVVVLSAADKPSLDRYALAFAEYFDSEDAAALADVAFTVQGRSAMPHRLAVCVSDAVDASAALRAYLDGRSHPALGTARVEAGASSDPADPTAPVEAAAAWLEGRRIPWERFQAPDARRVSLPSVPWQSTPIPASPEPVVALSASAQSWLVDLYAELAGIPAAQIDPHVPLTHYGLSSMLIARMNARLESELGEQDRTLFFSHTDLASVASELTEHHPEHWSSGSVPQEPIAVPTRAVVPSQTTDDGAIAVIGLAGRYPSSPDLDAFWQTLSTGRDSVSRIPEHRARAGWPVDQMWGGWLDAVDEFDPLLFQITPRDAALMDPQERLFLEVVWEMMEDAGYTRDRLARRHGQRVAVYAGAMYNEYPYFAVEQSLHAERQDSGATIGGIANRVSFFLDLHGPSLTLDTMCSSGLTALHLAVRALRGGECEAAIVGAVNLSLHPNKFVQQYRMKLNSSTNRCRSFGAGGDGFVPAEGAGALLFKPLRRAVEDGDRIHAVIRGTSVVHAGRTNGFLVPNPEAQGSMIGQAMRDAGVEPSEIGYLELHGAGTALGDPVEINGLMRVFGAAGLPVGSVPVGSVKSVIGHVEAGAGIAGLTKVILQMRHGEFAPSLHAEELNAGIAWDQIPFRVQRRNEVWPAGSGPRVAGISSFGAGGTIAHTVVQEAPAVAARGPEVAGAARLVVLSGYDQDQLIAVATRLAARLRRSPEALSDVAYTLLVGREALRERLAVVVRDVDELCDVLERFVAGRAPDSVMRGRVPSAGYAVGEPAADGDLDSLGQHWISGGALDGEVIARRDGAAPRIVSLPSYPFARMKCWLPEPGPQEIPLYERTWEPSATSLPAGTITGSVLCVFSEHSEQAARRFAERCGVDRVLLVREGADLGDGVPGYVTDAEATALADDLLARHSDLVGWLDLADLNRSSAERGLWRPRLAMLQRVVRARAVGGLRVMQVTAGLHVFEHAAPSLAGAPMAGFVRVLNAEYRRLAASVLDTDAQAGDPDPVVSEVLAEWGAADRLGEVCYRRGVRFLPALKSIDAPYRAWRADPEAAYLVVGGTRGIGALIARFLASRGARQLALVGTRSAPEDPALRDAGVRVLTHIGSVADVAGMSSFLEQVRTELGRIDGVVNCAGRSGQGAGFAYLDMTRLADTLEPKTDGVETLADLTAADRPSFSIQFSSICAAAPAVATGVTDYAAANATLDTITEHRIHAGHTWLRTLNWPQWSQTGGGRGTPNPCAALGIAPLTDEAGLRIFERMLALPPAAVVVPLPAMGAPVDVRGLTSVDGFGAEADAASMDGSGQHISAELAPAVAEQGNGAGLMPAQKLRAQADLAPVAAGGNGAGLMPAQSFRAPADLAPAVVAAGNGAEPAPGVPPAWLSAIFADQLGIAVADLDPTALFGDLGVESIMLGELLLAIEAHLGRSLEPSLLLDHPTVESLSVHLGVAEDREPQPPAAASAAQTVAVASEPQPHHRSQPESTDRIAVIGMSCRFADAPDLDTFWSNLLAGHCGVAEVPASRWDHRLHYRPEREVGFSISKWGGFVSGIEDFDPGYFRLGDAEATGLDPAIRMVLEGSVAALREAGYGDSDLGGGQVGVFVGARLSDYGRRVATGPGVLRSDQNFIAAHVAHFFDFHGPNLVVDSACSSSLAAVQLACRSLLAGESHVALAAGVEVLLDEHTYIDLSSARALSPTGRCRTFDRGADGFVPGEGCGVVLLKPLGAALADGDRIHAVIEAVALNNDGRTMGITTPNPAAQAAVVRSALAAAGRKPREIGLVEAHGTGTLIGDPIELRALTDVFAGDGGGSSTGAADSANGAPDASDQWCAIGSVKSNIGHTLSAAGIAGLAKAVLAVETGVIPATLFCDTPNPRFDFERSPFHPATTARPWTLPPAERVAGVSSFGLGGTNAHLVVSGLDPAWRDGHPAERSALPPPVFARRRLWLEATPTSATEAIAPAANPPTPTPPPAPKAASLLDLRLSIDGVVLPTER
ncbi:malonyl CoA-acyl carrier protein transacylase [Catenulispora acidiphila DSM 44928]|uniref:Malonyl CoA-acyl carrier protein transacylase n=1 Tax=Catenulispora acidiphila (strain DSM 44928 / JCM 14897 / NBRC 102108 / NRRL B-24433 / ID139908) TaxID=479433 RepID=C7PXR2_CATAD|nr:type I polyketide synthase [Catenulispora acidiphila]ACU71515.1 malonyl CoA-acyl carrier protein transacylase [Catenulispora acidiphila DSM 44928]